LSSWSVRKNSDAIKECECVQGFNATITTQMEDPRRRGPDQITEMNLQLHPGMRDSLAILCADPNTILVILSGSERTILDEVHSYSFLNL
jgi:hypothetical protein